MLLIVTKLDAATKTKMHFNILYKVIGLKNLRNDQQRDKLKTMDLLLLVQNFQ